MKSGSISTWRDVALEDVADELTVGYVGPMASEYIDDGIPFLRSLNVEPLRINKNNLKFITPEFHQRIQKSRLTPGDVVIVRTGKPGACSVVPEWLADANCSDLVIVRCGKELNNRFLAYYVNTVASDHVAAHLVGAVQQHFNVGSARTLRLNLPPLGEQKSIAAVLGALDDKIELNRQMNATLGAMARALFQSWFVDFDPVRAKLDALPPAGLDKATVALFPDHLEDSPLGHIPRGWTVGNIKDCCTHIQNGGTPRRNEPRFWDNGDIPWLTSGEVRQPIVTAPENFTTEAGLAESSAKWVPPLSTVIALYGATAGQVSLVSSRLTTNQAVCALVPKKHFAFFNYLWMRAATGELENKAVGSAQQNISKGIVEETQVVLAPSAVVEKFAESVSPLFDRWISNLHQSRTLATLRDTLLPKLLSGDLRVAEMEKRVSA